MNNDADNENWTYPLPAAHKRHEQPITQRSGEGTSGQLSNETLAKTVTAANVNNLLNLPGKSGWSKAGRRLGEAVDKIREDIVRVEGETLTELAKIQGTSMVQLGKANHVALMDFAMGVFLNRVRGSRANNLKHILMDLKGKLDEAFEMAKELQAASSKDDLDKRHLTSVAEMLNGLIEYIEDQWRQALAEARNAPMPKV